VVLDYLPENTDLAGLLSDLMKFKNVNVVFDHYEHRGEVFVKYTVYARFYAVEKLVDVNRLAEQSRGNFSLFRDLFKRELVASVLKAVGSGELFKSIDGIMTSSGMPVYDLYLVLSIDKTVDLLLLIYAYNPAISFEDLVSIAYSVKSLSEHISRVVLIEHPGGLRYTMSPRKYWGREFEIVREIPCCYGGMGASIEFNQVMYLNYTCAVERGYAVSEESLHRFVENVVSMLRNHEKYGEEFRKGYWILVIDEPPVTIPEKLAPAPQSILQIQVLDKSTVMTRILATLTTLALVLIFITLLARRSP